MPFQVLAAPQQYIDIYGEDLAEEIWYDDLDLLACVVEAEAGNQDFKGKCLVADVVLNRMSDERFPNTISKVIHQRNQFYPEDSNRLSEIGYRISEDSYKAVEHELASKEDDRILFYCAGYFPQYGYPAYQYGDHYFNYY